MGVEGGTGLGLHASSKETQPPSTSMCSPTLKFPRLYHLRLYGSFIDIGMIYLSYWPLVINFTPAPLPISKAELRVSYSPL